jgi:hypothetical protein
MKQTHQGMLHTHVASKNKDINEMIDAHAYEMQCNYGSQTLEVLHLLEETIVTKKKNNQRRKNKTMQPQEESVNMINTL